MCAKLYKRGFKIPHRFSPGKIALRQIRKCQKRKDYRDHLHYLMALMENLSLCSVHAKKITIKPKDIQLARLLHHKMS
ncbi:hypothetical protein SUGI_0608980 [Cryptomeria japonica]|nr:hypothetical protein SUGI_0608980 [Cryptomeria japonica]